uniref:HAT C-terminal dimerisation domain-containing protein n=3 Tax=Brassica TaxID=3705 RepID=A0A3P6E7W3_BRAOL|nr:unnamed protein product [Brassica oleracea]
MSDMVMDILRRLFRVYQDRYTNLNLQSSSVGGDENVIPATQNSQDMDVDSIDNPFLRFMVAKKTTSEVLKELDRYLKEELFVATANELGLPFDILSWWKTNSSKYPVMSLMAREVLAVPVSSVASERLLALEVVF